MKYQTMISKDAVLDLIGKRAADRIESAAIYDHAKADELMDLAREIGEIEPERAWISPERKPAQETLVLLRLEYGEVDGVKKKFVGTATYSKRADGTAAWRRVDDPTREISPKLITGWQYLPAP